ncbi:MAG: DUF362 domain-containing protein [Lentisphaerae bacterium]|nr:DUF362 domain-containing protein [Lentisphaerota bacterium]
MAEPVTVSLVPCGTYDPETLSRAVTRALAPLGGIEAFAGPGRTVLLKPNLLSDRPPAQAVTTHPELARALIRLLKPTGARIVVGDSPASVVKLESVWDKTGYRAVCREEDVELIGFEKAGSRTFDAEGCRFSLAAPVLDADTVINLPKVKTHVLTVLTAGVKNMYGAVPGVQKTILHSEYPRPDDYGRLMARIYRACPPQLTLADAVVGMHGDGPAGGRPIELGFLAASTDAAALDIALCRILNIPPRRVPYLKALAGLDGGAGLPEIAVTGADPDDFAPAAFTLPRTTPARYIPRPLVRLLAPLLRIRPAINDACIRCGRCVATCPVHALTLPGGADRPVLDPARCIACCCCHEICPAHAIDMRYGSLMRLIRGDSIP